MKNKEINTRNFYFDRIKPHIGKNIIKVISGQRRSGKSFFLLNIIDLIGRDDANSNIIFINKEHYEFDNINDYHDLQLYFDNNYKSDKSNYFFVDEIQEIEGFEKCLRNILSKNLADIYISGSNAEMLSGELASMLSGRYIELLMHPLSYSEFLGFYKLKNSQTVFYRYLKQGGMPGLIHIDQMDEPINDYLKGILSTVLLKDVVSRYKIRNVAFLENLVRFLADNVGSIVSAKNISDFLKSQKINVSPNIVLDYLSHLCNAYFTNKVMRMDVNGKKIFEIGEKYYFEDLGLRNTLVGYKIADISKILENVVYNHLIIGGYTVYIGQKGNKEIDFVAQKNGEILYIQVCYLLSGEQVFEREFGNLLSIDDNFEKIVVSMDQNYTSGTYKGVKHAYIPDFCLDIVSA